jgi:hypothetical protein
VVHPDVLAPFYREIDELILSTYSAINGIPVKHAKEHIKQSTLDLFADRGPVLYNKTRERIGLPILQFNLPVTEEEDPFVNSDLDSALNPIQESHRELQNGNHGTTWLLFGENHLSPISTEDYSYATQFRMEYFKPQFKHCTC